jgi:hypothetical protein
MPLTQPPPDFPPEGFTLYDDILDADEVFDDGTSGDISQGAELTITIDDIPREMVLRFFGWNEGEE